MPSEEGELEFEVLESIYNEIQIERLTSDGSSTVSILLYPKSADDTNSRNVTLKLEFRVPCNYPTTLPSVEIRNPRGLSEKQLEHIQINLEEMKAEFAGSPMLFQLIDMVQDYLTVNNRPSAECPICLMNFSESDVFYTPPCFHHYHNYCLGLHLQSLLKTKNEEAEDETQNSILSSRTRIDILCPVCRCQLNPKMEIEELLASPPATEDLTPSPVPVEVIMKNRVELDALFEKQKKQGGIIELDKATKHLLRISDPVETSGNTPTPSSEL